MKPSILVNDLTKIYHLYQSPKDRLKETLHLTKRNLHEDFYALRNVSFEVYPGETIGIIGKNGAGKSTLLKIITGVLTPSSGSVHIEGKISALLELGAGFNTEFTGLENIYLNGTIMGYSRDEMKMRMQAILEFADIGEFIHQPVKSYSSGMFMRLAFSVAINVDPEILIVDEALSVGDILFQAKCFKKIQEFKEKGKTILFVSHSLNNILQYCDRCIVLNDGMKLSEGDSPAMVDLFKQLLATPKEKKDNITALVKHFNQKATKDDLHQILRDRLILNKNYLEYGDQTLTIIDFGIIDAYGQVTNIIDAGKSFQIIMRVQVNAEKEQPIFAFSIKDIHGVEITGTNTLYNDIDTGHIYPGDSIEVVFTQTLPLLGDGYLLSLGCTGYDQDEFVVYHRLYDIAPIQVINEKQIVGYFDPRSSISCKKMT